MSTIQERVPHAGRLFLSLWLVYIFFGDPLLEISTVRYLYLARAVAEESRFTVDTFAHRSRGDLALINGHLYSGSPPGLGLILTPLAHVRQCLGDSLPFRPNLALQILALLLVQAPATAGATVLLLGLLHDLGLPRRRATWVGLAFALGTPLFFFTAKISDYPLIALLQVIIARIALTWRRNAAEPATDWWRALAAGGVLGICYAVNDLAFLTTSLFLFLAAPWRTRATGLRVAGIVLGTLPTIVARAVYMTSCFGSPWANPLEFSAAGISVTDDFHALGSAANVGLAMLMQSPRMAWDITFGDVGLFVFAPAFLLLWWWRAAGRNTELTGGSAARGDLLAFGRAGILVVLVNAALHITLINGQWKGGACWGPRYLLFSAIPLALALARAAAVAPPRSLMALTSLSVLVNWIGVQYGYNTSVLDATGRFLLGGATTPAFRWLWLNWAVVPTPERIALVLEETPRLGAYYAFTHPSPMILYLFLALVLAAIWRPVVRRPEHT